MSIAVSIILVIFFLVMNGFFVVAEFSLVKIRKSQVDMMVANKRVGSKYTGLVAENVNAYLSACQLGITLASLALGWLGEPAVAALLRPLLSPFGLSEGTISAIAVVIGFSLITTLHIIVGELIPKSLAIFSTEKYALLTAPILVWFYRMTYPIMWLFNSITNGVLRLMGHSLDEQHQVYTEEEIMLLMEESSEKGIIDKEHYQYMDNIFDLEDKDAETIMTPRTDLVCFYEEDTLEDYFKTTKEHMFTRYPLCREEKDNIIGFVHIKDLYTLPMNGDKKDLKVRTIEPIPESLSVSKILQLFQEKKTKIAMVVDEHGGTSGIVTLSDIVGQIVGKMEDEYTHDEEEVITLELNHYLMDGSLSIDVFADMLDLKMDEMMEYETLGGFLFEQFDCIPKKGDEITYYNVKCKVKKMEGHRIISVDVRVLPLVHEEED